MYFDDGMFQSLRPVRGNEGALLKDGKMAKNINSIENIKSGNSVNHFKTLISKELIYKHPIQHSKPETEANLETRKQNRLLQDLLFLLLPF